ncbi:homocysteine biosynthesis protein [Desulfurobacterium sp.]|uniref:homocysteine biosynthesis protein n=1 Tax=Desulfurobacterium sp. TaxID=2004706 RepID=UPI0026105997|nr:homocysteine biosynthesis protein [Desulfurobacterium sp.]
MEEQFKVNKTYEEINEKIRRGEAVVVTAEEMIEIVEEMGVVKAAEEVDVVTTGTFGAMCSSGAFLNVGHTRPKMKMEEIYLNGVPAYGALAAVDLYIGASALPENDPRNEVYPGRFEYGGAHVIEELIAGEDIELEAYAYGTDCYPRREIKKIINIKTVRDAILCNPRNCYQNYNVAVNKSSRTIYTYMGILRPNMGNATYSSAGQLSPLLNDPFFETIGIGTRIFLGGGVGYIAFHGTQHAPFGVRRTQKGQPVEGSGTIMTVGDMKQMSTDFIRAASIIGYGVSLFVGIGIPIPILNERIAFYTSVKDSEILAPVYDYSSDYPSGEAVEPIAYVNYGDLRKGQIEINGKKIQTCPLSSYYKAREIANILKDWIKEGRFEISRPAERLPAPEPDVKIEYDERK